jgi:hypothetical protein
MNERDVHAELTSIRELMERSSKFISLSGLAGILAGLYALAGARFAFRAIENLSGLSKEDPAVKDAAVFLSLVGLAVFILSLMTAYWLTVRKAKKRNENVWNPVSRRMLAAIAFPMLTGGLVIGILLLKQEYTYISSVSLLFYGLALVAGSQFTFSDIRWLGIGEILLGLLALAMPENSVLLWTVGFGVLHILYGTIMYFKYER